MQTKQSILRVVLFMFIQDWVGYHAMTLFDFGHPQRTIWVCLVTTNATRHTSVTTNANRTYAVAIQSPKRVNHYAPSPAVFWKFLHLYFQHSIKDARIKQVICKFILGIWKFIFLSLTIFFVVFSQSNLSYFKNWTQVFAQVHGG